jgi:CHAT domain-containing protein
MSEKVLALLKAPIKPPADRILVIEILAIEAVAYARLHSFVDADLSLDQAEKLCHARSDVICGSVIRAQGIVALERGQLAPARTFFAQSLSFARLKGDVFLEASALLNLSASSLKEEHFDEAVDWSDAAYRIATSTGAESMATKSLGNLAWAHYRLGDLEKALNLSLEAENAAIKLGDVFDQENELTNIGYIYMDQRQYDLAEQNFQQALRLAEGIEAKQDEYNALRVLARLSLERDEPGRASHYAEAAWNIAHESGNHTNELYPLLVQGQVSARRGDIAKAQQIFGSVEHDPACPVFLKWDAQHSLARLYESHNQPAAADREYRSALATFEAERANVRHEDFQLSFLTNAARIYDDYVNFLVAQGKPEEGLRWADYSRARTLSEGLGLLSNENGKAKKGTPLEAPELHPRTIATHAKAVILYYWLGEKQSYLWAMTPRETKVFRLPARSDIEEKVKRYRAALTGPGDVLDSLDENGIWLYGTLVAPAQSLLPKGARVILIPDGNLHNLNFETLIVSDPAPHYWIEDAVITDSSSLRVLAASFSSERKHNSRKMLLIGNSIPPDQQYLALPNARAQMESVASHFVGTQRLIFSGADATPAAYLASHPERFSAIHFVAHGIASRLSPLDSAIVLSRDPAETDAFKLYARDIIRHPLRADLVTISACYGAGERSYSGEGLVGLAWAFLRAGAHNVIAGLWEVTDASTEQLMARFYDELDKGARPDAALRAAKLSLLHGSAFRNPFYWAPFQLYAGS